MVLHHYSVAITIRQYVGVVAYITQILQFTIDTTEFLTNKAVAVRGGKACVTCFTNEHGSPEHGTKRSEKFPTICCRLFPAVSMKPCCYSTSRCRG
jgi:hypothetical protein